MSEAQTRLPWSAEEDNVLIELVQKYGEKRWNVVATGLPGRTGKGCSHRWRTYLRPDVKHPHLEPFTEWEAAVIVQAQRDMGNNWLAIAKLLLPGRSNTAVKNFWHCRLKGGCSSTTNRFILENYNLRYLLNEVPEKDKLYPVSLPAFPSTAPTGHVRKQIHPRPRQEAAAQAAAAAEAAMFAQQVASQAQAMGMDPQAYMQQVMSDPNAYAAMYGSYEGYEGMPEDSNMSKEELKQHASSYVQQQLAMMGHPAASQHGSGGGSSGDESAAAYNMGYDAAQWAYGADGQTPAAAAAAGATGAGVVKKSGRGRGRPPGSKKQRQAEAAAAAAAAAAAMESTAAAAAAAAEAMAEHQAFMRAQQYGMNARTSQDDTSTWCSAGAAVLAGSAAAAAAAAGGAAFHGGSPVPEVPSSSAYGGQQPAALQPGSLAVAADPFDPAALAAAPVPLDAAASLDAAAAAAVSAPAVTGLLPSSAGPATDLEKMPNFRVSMTGLDMELEAANGGSSLRFSTRSLKFLDCEDPGPVAGAGAGVAAAVLHSHKGPSISSIDFRASLRSFDDMLAANGANRLSDHTHIALRGPSWDGSSPDSRPSDATAVTAAVVDNGAAAAEALSRHAITALEASEALAATFKVPQHGSSSNGAAASNRAWTAAHQAAAGLGAATAAAARAAGSAALSAAAAGPQGSQGNPAAVLGPDGSGVMAPSSSGTPFGASGLQSAPFSPATDRASGPCLAPGPLSQQQQQRAEPCNAGAAAELDQQQQLVQSREPPAAPRLPAAFHSVLQALQPPPVAAPGSSAAVPACAGAEPHQQQQKQVRAESALAAASPAITGLNVGVNAVNSLSMGQGSFYMSAEGPQQQLPMPAPLPPQLILPPQYQQVAHARVSDLPLPSPIDLFNGEHGLQGDDLLIDPHSVFDERVLEPCAQQEQQQQQLALLHQQHRAGLAEAGAAQRCMQYSHAAAAQRAAAAAAGLKQGNSCSSKAGTLVASAGARQGDLHAAAAATTDAVMMQGSDAGAAALQGGAAAAGAAAKQGLKRQRSSGMDVAWGKRTRPSDGSLVEVHRAPHAMDDCLTFWHHD